MTLPPPRSTLTHTLFPHATLFRSGSIEDISIERLSEEGGVSRGLLYHYFGSKQGFHEAVVQRAVDDLVEQTAPPEGDDPLARLLVSMTRSEEHTSELQSLMRISYAVFCLKKKTNKKKKDERQ